MSRVALPLLICIAGCTSARVRGEPHLEMYNIQDLVIVGSGFAGTDDPNEELPAGMLNATQFAEKAKRAITPLQWDQDGWRIAGQNGLLIVRADAEAQRSVLAYLASERANLEKK